MRGIRNWGGFKDMSNYFMNTFAKMITENQSIDSIGAYLDSLSPADRLREVQSFPGKLMLLLFQKAKTVSLQEMAPFTSEPLKEIIFHGKNSLPAFFLFQKRMCRSPDGNSVWGYNHQPLQKLTGPGYFVVSENTDRPGEVMIDYTKIPYQAPLGWPKLKANTTGITYLVYGNMKDFMKKVSKNIFIGEATKKSKKIGQYFLLCRQGP